VRSVGTTASPLSDLPQYPLEVSEPQTEMDEEDHKHKAGAFQRVTATVSLYLENDGPMRQARKINNSRSNGLRLVVHTALVATRKG
jgi:hypothetical protein